MDDRLIRQQFTGSVSERRIQSSPTNFLKTYFLAMQSTKPGLANDSAIEVIVPQPWRTIGKLFNMLLLFSCFGSSWLAFIATEPHIDGMVLAVWVSFISAIIVCCHTLPVFLNKYPAWLVRLVGKQYLNKFIADCKKHLGENRTEKAHFFMPNGWFADKKVFWIVFIASAFVLGILAGVGWL
jgi:hypothetical protein